ncbi:MAG: winged helix-turn-helix domain-containing protein [Nitrososphaerales archaeon]
MEASVQISRQNAKNRSDIEIIAAILKATSQNGGIMITNLRERANLSWASLTRYVSLMVGSGLLREEISDDGNLHFVKIYRPSEKGFEFLIAYGELMMSFSLKTSIELP